MEGLGGSLGDLVDLGVGEKFRLADFGATHAILPRSSRLWTQPKSCRPHARGLDFGPRSTHAKKRGSRIVRKCRGRTDFGRRRDFFDPRNFAWVEQNLAPARFGPTLGPGQVWPKTDFEGTLHNSFWPSLALYGSVCNSEGRVLHRISARIFCFFYTRGWILGPLVRFSGLGVDIPARGRFWLVLGCRKR